MCIPDRTSKRDANMEAKPQRSDVERRMFVFLIFFSFMGWVQTANKTPNPVESLKNNPLSWALKRFLPSLCDGC